MPRENQNRIHSTLVSYYGEKPFNLCPKNRSPSYSKVELLKDEPRRNALLRMLWGSWKLPPWAWGLAVLATLWLSPANGDGNLESSRFPSMNNGPWCIGWFGRFQDLLRRSDNGRHPRVSSFALDPTPEHIKKMKTVATYWGTSILEVLSPETSHH